MFISSFYKNDEVTIILKFILISPKNRTVYNFRGDLIREIKALGYEVIVTGPNTDGIEEIEKLGVRFVEIPLHKNGLNVFEDIRYIFRLKKLFDLEKPDITLGYTIKPVIYGGIAARLARVKSINSMITGAGYVFAAKTIKARMIRFIVSMLYRTGFMCANTVIFQNPDDLEEFIKRRLLKKHKCKLVNGSGVNMDKFARHDFPETITFFMLSRILYSKGVCEFLDASKIVKQQYPDVRFVLLGALENMQDSLSQEELKPYIDAGIIEYFDETDNIIDFYRKSSVYVLPSYREGTPRTVLEAMSMGRPIITTDAPGCRETVINGVNGYLVPVADSKSLADKMIWFINNPKRITEMGNESEKLCREKFDVNKVNKQMLRNMNML